MRCELQRLGESTEKQLATVLTEKQMREYQKMQDELQPRSPENGQQGMGGERPGGRGGMGGGRGGGVGEAWVEVCHRECNPNKTPGEITPDMI